MPPFIRGKVRDTYQLNDRLLIVASDRISAFDVILPCGIPRKGQVLNQLSAFWFKKLAGLMPNHLLEVVNNARCLSAYLPTENHFAYPSYLNGRSMVVKKAGCLPVECIVRGYLSGSAWEEYREHGTVSGLPLPKGLRESEELSEPIFTPTTKAESGHDMPLSTEEVKNLVGEPLAEEMKTKSLTIYHHAQQYAITKGFIIADTKLEFGLEGEQLILIDELLTPDSSRFWDTNLYQVGQPQDSFDKQPVRDWLSHSRWNKEPPAPMLPKEVIEQTSQKYQQAYKRLTGKTLDKLF